MSEKMRSFKRDMEAITTLHGDRPAFIPTFDGQRAITYAETSDLIRKHLGWLRDLGLTPGDTVGALLPNSMEMLVLFLACLQGGYGFAPLACDSSRREVEDWVRLIKPGTVVLGGILPDEVIAGLTQSAVKSKRIVIDGTFAHLDGASAGADGGDTPDAKIFLYTSGTTGQPKAIVIDGNTLWSSGYEFTRFHGLTFDSPFRIWNYLPHSYLGGLFNLCLIPFSVAGTVIVDHAFSGNTFLGFWQTVDRFDMNVLWFVPTIVRGLISVGDRARRSGVALRKRAVDIAFLGTAPIGLETKEKFESLFDLKLLENFALSETTFITSETVSGASAREPGSTGAPLPYVNLKFRPVEGDAANTEILVKTPYLFDGYLDKGGAVTPSLEDGFFPTGDIGYLSKSGALIVTGRCKDIIKRGGQLVSLREIEDLVSKHPAIEQAAATPVPHPFYGESYKLFVRLKENAAPDAVDSITTYVHGNLARYKWPEAIESVSEFPQTGSGKVRKYLLAKSG